jgi:membrane-associated phospholipid phosphatase
MSRKLLCLGILLMALTMPAGADVVTDWNEVLLDAIRADRTAPPKAARAMACVHVSIFEAVNGILGGYAPYHVTTPAPAGASPEAAAAAAAHRSLTSLFPAREEVFDAALAASLAAIPEGTAKAAGVAWGTEVADEIIALRQNDRSADTVEYAAPLGGSWWAPTPPAFASALLPNWPLVTPWAIPGPAQFRSGPPPAPHTAEYRAAFDEVKRLGRAQSRFRSAEQTQIAQFWADGAGTATPPGHWLAIAADLAEARNLGLLEKTRLFALLGMAVADAALVSWDHKYQYHHWRPVTGIQNADLDGNPATAPDKRWTPLLPTPPFPAYSSGHSTFSGASARILELFFGTDQISFTTTSDGLPGVTRSFASLSAAAEEAGQSRIYGGIHWQYDNQAGLASGRALAEHVFFKVLSPVGPPELCWRNINTLCLNNLRFMAKAVWRAADGTTGMAVAVPGLDDSGQFYFFISDNIELNVKVLNGCGVNGHYWVFASGLTDLEVVLTVTDVKTGLMRQYFNPRGKAFAPVQDTAAFATCDR